MARPATRFAHANEEQLQQLNELWKSNPNHTTRTRAHAILLSQRQFTITQITEILLVHRDSVQSWIDRFEAHGTDGLLDEDRPGGPRLLDEDETKLLDELFEQFPKQPARVLEELKNKTGKTISRDTLREYARRLGRSWKRSRRSLKAKRDAQAFAKCRAELQQLIGQPDLDVVFFDEAGFSLKGVVGMGWFRRGERAEVPVTGSHGSSVQTLGFEQPDGSVVSYLHKGYVNSQTVIAVFDDYVKRIDGDTMVVLDNASCHTSAAFKAACERWAERGLYVYNLSPYSPELNSIERFWRKLKHQLLPETAWSRFQVLLADLTAALNRFGEVTYLPSLDGYAE